MDACSATNDASLPIYRRHVISTGYETTSAKGRTEFRYNLSLRHWQVESKWKDLRLVVVMWSLEIILIRKKTKLRVYLQPALGQI